MLLGLLFYGPLLVIVAIAVVPLVRPSLKYACGQAARIGLVVGFALFLVGFIGPILFTPGANQGPLLGIFFTGPAGFVLGAVVGFLRALKRPPPARPAEAGVEEVFE